MLPDVGGMQERFGGNAADVQARAAQFRIFLNHRGLEAVLSGADRSGVATRPAADNHEVVSHSMPV